MTFLEDVAALVVILSVVVFIHEFGHFAMAKALGFPVEVFSFGFGKRLIGKTWRGTDYRISALPFGGYVRVPGLGPDESTTVGAASEPSERLAGTRWQRGLILLAGPVMNFVLAISVQSAVFIKGMPVPRYRLEPPVVGSIVPDSPGVEAGFAKGDLILSIDGTAMKTWQDVEFAFAIAPRQKLAVSVERAGQQRLLSVTPRGISKFDVGVTGVGPALKARVGRVFPHAPAAAAGIAEGDVILTIAGETIDGVPEVSAMSRHAPGPIPIVIRRGAQTITVSVSPRQERDGWKIGVALAPDVPQVIERFPPIEAVRQGWRSLRADTHATVGVLLKLFAGRASVKQMSGPIAIGQFAGEAAREGAIPFIQLVGALSLQLGILNLVPVPMLDGGQFAILLIEGGIRRDLSWKLKERILQFGLLVLVLLMGVVIYNDILKIF